jgi:hypothetical protein
MLSYCFVQELPGCLVKLPKLSCLIASHNNGITRFPQGVSKLSLLTDLQMSHCRWGSSSSWRRRRRQQHKYERILHCGAANNSRKLMLPKTAKNFKCLLGRGLMPQQLSSHWLPAAELPKS